MTKLFACFALFCLIGTAFSAVGDACVTNSLLTLYDFDMEDEEVDGSAFKYCKSLQAGTSCCAASIVDGFQDDMDTLAETLTDSVIKRDKAIIELRDTTIPALSTKLTALQTNAEEALTTLAAAIAAEAEAEAEPAETPEDEPTVQPYSLAEASELATNLLALAEDITSNLEDATEGFTDFQKARSSCVVEMLGLQAAAWCLACDPTAADQGVGDAGAITIADDTCTRLQGACYEYVTASVTQSSILNAAWISSIIDDLNTALEAVAEEANEDALQLLSSAVEPAEAEEMDAEAAPVEGLPECTSEDDCTAICGVFFTAGEINKDMLVIGGFPSNTPLVETTPVEAEAEARRLQAEWEPAADEAGVTITWEDDPAGVNSDDDDTVTPAGAGIIKSGFVCVIALLSVFFF